MRRKGHYTLVDTFNPTKMYNKESFVDYCESCETDYDKDCECDWHKWAEEESRMDLDYLFDNLNYCYGLRGANNGVIVEGRLESWWGNLTIEQQYYGDVVTAIKDCIDGAYDIIIRKEKHKLVVSNLYHDGRNDFTITFLTPTGEDRYKRNGKVSTTNRENIVKLFDYLY